MRSAIFAVFLLAVSSYGWAYAFAQVLRDPTQPPAALERPAVGSAPEATSGPTLQSIIVSEGRKIALIDGKMYRAGDKFGDTIVAGISSNEVTLRGGEGIRVLKLYPDLQKTTSSGAPGAAHRRGGP